MIQTQASPKKTPLYDCHLRLGARMVDFAGWSMPVQYKGLREEHTNVRKNVGLFDVSHMGELRVEGPKALESLEAMTTNHVASLQAGQAHYSLLPNEKGGLVDDIIIYCVTPGTNYLVCVNAANKDKDYAWMREHAAGANISDESSAWAQIAVQGPQGPALIAKVLGVSNLVPFTHQEVKFQGARAIVAATGYTGEKGGEIFIEAHKGAALWEELMAQGEPLQVMSIGLGARDTLRLEMKYSLYGHEIDDTTNPFEAGLGWVVKAAAKDFIGKKAMLEAREKGLTRRLVGFKMLERGGIPRQGYRLLDESGQAMGIVTSGTHSPSLDEPIGIGYVALPHSSIGSKIAVEIRGRAVRAEVCKTPFVQPRS